MPLHLAADLSRHDMGPLEGLLMARANANVTDTAGMSVLAACTSGAAVRLLVKHRADVNLRRSPSFKSPLQGSCARFNPTDAVAALIDCKAEVHPGELCNLAMAASMQPHTIELAELLLLSKAEIDARPPCPAVHRCAELACRARLVLPLPEPPAAYRYVAESSSSALGHACFWGSVNLAAFLLGARADPQDRNNRGRLPAKLCEL